MNDMRKILYIAVSSQTGGAPKHIVSALKRAKRFGYEITVAVPDDGDDYPKIQEAAADMLNLSLKPYSLKSLWTLRNYVVKHKIELVHSHGKGAGMYGRPLKWLCPGIKVVHTFHGIYLERYGALLKKVYCTIEHILRRWTDVFICVSNSEREEALRLGFAFEKRIKVIENGVDLTLFQKAVAHKEAFLDEYSFPMDTCLIGCVARLEAMKGHDCLIQAFERVSRLYPKCRLVLVGDGPDRMAVEHRIRECKLEAKVAVTGYRHDIPELLKAFDVFVSASLKEGMPYTLIEALAAGVPVVATDVIGNRDVIRDGYNGVLVKSQDSEDMAEKLCWVIENPEMCKRYADAGIQVVAETFTEERSMGRLFEVYGGLLR